MAVAKDQQLDDYIEGDDIIADDIQYKDNFEVLLKGSHFKLLNNAAFLNCVMLQETAYSEQKLYAKIINSAQCHTMMDSWTMQMQKM
eukprot:7763454-Ditylum_brightwellii.AAC.1